MKALIGVPRKVKTGAAPETVWVNPEHVIFLREESSPDDSWTEIHFAGNTWTSTGLSMDETVERFKVWMEHQ